MPVASGVYYIRNVGSGTVIDLKGGSSLDGTDTQGWAKHLLSNAWAPAQLWVVFHESGDEHTIQNTSGRTYLELNSPVNGTPVEGFKHTSAAKQRWVIVKVPGKNYYTIQNKETKTLIDLAEGKSANGTKVQGWAAFPVDTNKNQLWYLDHV